VLTCHYLEKAGTIVGVRAVALLACLPEDFKKSCYIGRSQVPVPAAWVDKLLPGIFALREQLRTQAQASSKRDLDFSALALTDTLILLAEAVFQGMPFRIQEYGASYALLQLPAVREIVTLQQWGEFAAKVVSSHGRMEQLRQAPWQAMLPGLAGTLSQLQGDVQSLTAAVQQQTAAGQVQQAQGAAGPAAQPEHAPQPAAPVLAAAAGASGRPAAAAPDDQQQLLPLPEERPQVASRLLCSRVRTVREAYEVRRAATLAVPAGCWQHVWTWLVHASMWSLQTLQRVLCHCSLAPLSRCPPRRSGTSGAGHRGLWWPALRASASSPGRCWGTSTAWPSASAAGCRSWSRPPCPWRALRRRPSGG
jgi:hypothetical protein